MPIERLLDSIRAFFANPIIISALLSWLLAQVMKGIISLLDAQTRTLRGIMETLFWRTGGMPSSHAAVVTSMAAAVAFYEGVSSNLFAVSLISALIVMRDAMGVRRASGLQARTLNLLGIKIAEKQDIEYQPVKEIRGHHPLEVVVGALVGFFIAAAYAWL